MQPDKVTSSIDIPGHRIVRNVGIVRGLTVRSRSVLGEALSNFQIFFGGNIGAYINLCEKARSDTYALMCEQAERNGANAIISMRYDTTDIKPGVTEVLCYGTAVVVEPL